MKTRLWKNIIVIFVDILLINLSYLFSLYFAFIDGIPSIYIENYYRSFASITIIYILCFYVCKVYRNIWIYASISEFMLIILGCIISNILSVLWCLTFETSFPITVNVLAAALSILLVVGFRISFRIYRRLRIYLRNLDKESYKRVVIYGAGAAGMIIINEIKRHPEMKYYPVALIDDDKQKLGREISGVIVYGDRSKINEIVKEKSADEIIIAISTLKGEERKKVIDICEETGCKTKLIPGIYDLIDGKVSLKQIRDVNVEELLGREQINLYNEEISEYLEGKIVLVTGGGGSIGSELCRQITRFCPKQLLIIDNYENNAYDIQNELKDKYPNLSLKVIIASVQDNQRMEMIFNHYKPEIIFHAAAHKHVPLMEDNPTEAVKNNIFGTLNVVECAHKYMAQSFVMISTDKAVNPTNIMGASKRVCEMIIQAMDKKSDTKFVAVRFGNVLESNGSVIPLFKSQIAKGGPVTVTNKNITRYFMTIPEASQLVLQAAAYAEGGEVFVLDMGEPIKIYDLACDLIRLSGFEPYRDIKIEITGLRPGEKMYEELLMSEEELSETKHEKIFIEKAGFIDIEVLKKKFEDMKFIVENGSKEELVNKIKELVITYKPADDN